jgi:hypothetical protein
VNLHKAILFIEDKAGDAGLACGRNRSLTVAPLQRSAEPRTLVSGLLASSLPALVLTMFVGERDITAGNDRLHSLVLNEEPGVECGPQ